MSSAPEKTFIEVVFGVERGKRFELKKDREIVGRGNEADIVLDDPTVSRRHVLLERLEAGVRVVDLGSENGLRVGGEKVAEKVLSAGATFEIGSTVLAVRAASPDDEARHLAPNREADTQRMAVVRTGGLGADVQDLPQAGDSERPPDVARHMEKPHFRPTKPGPLLARLVSWVVILGLVTGGVLLMLKLMESGAASFFQNPAKGTAQDDESSGVDGPRGRRLPVDLPEEDDQTLLAGTPVAAPPDVAVQRLKEASRLENEGKFEEAVAVLEEIATKYPEFIPPGGTPVLEKADVLKKSIAYAATIGKARADLDDGNLTKEALQDLIIELGAIPTTDGQFGAEAVLLSERARSRLRQISLGFVSATDADITSDSKGDTSTP